MGLGEADQFSLLESSLVVRTKFQAVFEAQFIFKQTQSLLLVRAVTSEQRS
jgi:hypothetical protein